MDFIKNLSLDDHHDKKPESHATAPAPVPAKSEGLFDKLTDVLHGDHKAATPAPHPVAGAAPKHENIIDKIGGALKGDHKETPPPPPPPAPKSEGLLDKISDALKGDHKATPPAAAPVAHEPESVFDKIGAALGHEKPPPAAKKPDLLSTISDVVGGKKEEPAKPQGLFDKVNHALGGGAAGEEKEGKLDKVIDLFQEHVLKEGPQHNESAIEQAKDHQIAKTLRDQLEKVTGHSGK